MSRDKKQTDRRRYDPRRLWYACPRCYAPMDPPRDGEEQVCDKCHNPTRRPLTMGDE